jgi:hypothetical protein
MSRSETWMNTPIHFLEPFEHVAAKRQQSFVCRQGHAWIPPFDVIYPHTNVPENLVQAKHRWISVDGRIRHALALLSSTPGRRRRVLRDLGSSLIQTTNVSAQS